MTPLVTCLCLTKNRREWLPAAIDSFLASTYPNRELLILNSGIDVLDLVPDDGRISLIHRDPGLTIGELRNHGVKMAAGEIIAHWDDDDYSAPDRINDQVTRLMFSGKAVTGYSSMVFESDTEKWMFTALSNFAIGTSLCYRRDFALANPFPPIQVGEDAQFCNKARDMKQLVSVPAMDMMRASIHPGNTSPRILKGDNWTHISRISTKEAVSA